MSGRRKRLAARPNPPVLRFYVACSMELAYVPGQSAAFVRMPFLALMIRLSSVAETFLRGGGLESPAYGRGLPRSGLIRTGVLFSAPGIGGGELIKRGKVVRTNVETCSWRPLSRAAMNSRSSSFSA